jgi:hypothetical protein
VAQLALVGFNLNIINYWAVIANYIDYISPSASLVAGTTVLATDRLGTASGAFRSISGSSATAPVFNYFSGGAASFSITLWCSLQTAGGQAILDFSYNSADDVTLSYGDATFSCTTTQVGFAVCNAATCSTVCASTAMTVGVWYHLAATYNWATATSCFYVNGVGSCFAGQQSLVSYVRNTNTFGTNTWGESGDFLFDEVKFHGRVLTSAEVLADRAYNKSYITLV